MSNNRHKLVKSLCISLCVVIYLNSLLTGQEITGVYHQVSADDKIIVHYQIKGIEEGSSYKISLHVSLDGGINFQKQNKVSGDVGKINANGPKRIVWDALAERDELVSDEIIFKVIGSRPFTERIASKLNGWDILLGYHQSKFTNDYISELYEQGSLGGGYGLSGGINYIEVPLIFGFSGFYAPLKDEGKIFEAMYLTYSGGIDLNHYGGRFSVSYLVLTFQYYLLPTIGVGYQISELRLSREDGTKEKLSSSSTSTAYYSLGFHSNFHETIAIVGSMDISFGESVKKWITWNLSFSI